MGWAKDIVKVLNGFSLVAKETVVRQSQGGDLLQSLVKKTILSATDLTGLTKGKPRHLPHRAPPIFGNTSSAPAPTTTRSNGEESSESFLHSAVEEPIPTPPLLQSDPVLPVSCVSDGDSISSGSLLRETIKSDLTTDDKNSAADADAPTPPPQGNNNNSNVPLVKRHRKPRERRVPSTPFSRALGFAGLGAGLAWGTIQESAKRIVFGTPNSQDKQSPFLSEKNAERLALALCRMRGAALKLGQMLSIQDESLVPAPILAALDIVRQGADVMPRNQLNQVLNAELGPDWSSKLINFEDEPMAAASIGQVHRAVTKEGFEVAMKIQYPGVADSIESDIENVKLLLNYTNLIPEKLFLDNAMKVAKVELSRECNYELEAENQKRFRNLLSDMKGFYVPIVVDDLSSKRVLTTELIPGVPIDKVASLDQDTRNYVGTKLLQLTLMELFVFRFMQTDPNWSNFLYDKTTKVINLIDFGAAREYHKQFVDDYLRMVIACADSDQEAVIEMSQRLGFLTGMETEVMLDAHVQAGFIVGLPFAKSGGYDFRSTNITSTISNLGATMLRHRLTPPPEEVYSLHRKLAGAFLACIKLGAVVSCRELLLEVYETHQFGNDSCETTSTASLSR